MERERTGKPASDLGLDPLIPMTMAEMVEIKLQEYIREKDFKVGDALPKELELSEALGVSRNVIREALSRFRMLGLIESRKKRGMILTSPDVLGGIERVLHPKLLSKEVLKDIFEMRLVLEMGMAELLFARITEKDIKDLERIVGKKKNAVARMFKLEFEVEFHGKLYEISGNLTLKRFQYMLLPVFEKVVQLESEQPGPPKVCSATHEDLVGELKRGDAESFRATMGRHLEPHFDLLQDWNNGSKNG